ncbi:unnamed protein product [Pocillopora meandrina]|uniref:G-protein coupled receptors family 1 profile domain-containing protein n=1 Tax=Pocillopora meandrina TaxID=46732 RepID=A0AAU9WTZ4_9CNID|nr:unnamed protein product [Pocillopora meandrina]
MENASDSSPVHERKTEAIAKATLCMSVLAVSLLENAMVVLVLKKNFRRSHMRNANSLFIANISVADIFFAIQNIPHAYNNLVLNGHWILQGNFGTVLCKIDMFLSVITMVTANLTILAIAIYRLCVVFFPLRKIITRKTCFFIIFLTWLVPALFALPIFHFAKFISNEGITICSLKDQVIKIFYAGFAVILFTTLLAMLVLYAAIGFKLWRRNFPNNVSERARALREKRNRISVQKLTSQSYQPRGLFNKEPRTNWEFADVDDPTGHFQGNCRRRPMMMIVFLPHKEAAKRFDP